MVKCIIDARVDSYEKDCFLYGKLLERIRITYGGFLFHGRTSTDEMKALIDLDRFIRSNHSELSKKMESLSFGTLMPCFIKKWRDSNYDRRFSFYKKYLRVRHTLKCYK